MLCRSQSCWATESSRRVESAPKADTWQIYNEGPELEYKVVETVPDISYDEVEANEDATSGIDPWELDEYDFQPSGTRPFTLSIDIADLQVRIIQQTNYDTENHSVRRMRIVSREPPFQVSYLRPA